MSAEHKNRESKLSDPSESFAPEVIKSFYIDDLCEDVVIVERKLASVLVGHIFLCNIQELTQSVNIRLSRFFV